MKHVDEVVKIRRTSTMPNNHENDTNRFRNVESLISVHRVMNDVD